ncbi:MAG: BACON domain-containing protein, partial [Deltaproteobacteria bacterium]|nr:BACON domain-containing protein [Deltaproteobacteria bacterium]
MNYMKSLIVLVCLVLLTIVSNNLAQADCTDSINPTNRFLDSSAGTGVINVTATSTCAWTAVSNVGWLTVTGGGAGTGSGTVTYSVTANNLAGATTRIGTIDIVGTNTKTLWVTQQAGAFCPLNAYVIAPIAQLFPSAGGASTITVTVTPQVVPPHCEWAAASNDSWIHITSASTGVDDGTVNYSVDQNTTPATRIGMILVAGQEVQITQNGICTYTISSTTATFSAPASTAGTFNVTTQTGCAWTATVTSGGAWLSVLTGAAGNGNGTVTYTLTANTTGASRVGTIVVADAGGFTVATHTVTQTACSYTISSSTATFSAAATTGGTFNVTTQTGCAWTSSVTSGGAWLSVLTGVAGNGNGTVTYSLLANNTGASRIGTIVVADNNGVTVATHTVTQTACTYTVSPTSNPVPIPAIGGTGTIPVSASTGCSWTAAPNGASPVGMLNIISGNAGTGIGTVTYTVAANATAGSLQGFIDVKDSSGNLIQTYTVNQAAPTCTYTLSSTSTTFGEGGGTGVFTVISPTGCNFGLPVSSSPSWLHVTSPANFSPVAYTVDPITSGTSTRTGTIMVGSTPFTVTQNACTYVLTPTTQTIDGAGGNGSFTVTTQAGCNTWTALPSVAWLTVTSAANVSPVTYTVAVNTTGATRIGTIMVGPSAFTVTQNACSYVLNPTSLTFDATTHIPGGSFTAVPTQAGCTFTPVSTAPSWLIVTSAANASPVMFDITSANTTGAPRTGTILIGGLSFTVTQSPCTFTISPSSRTFDSSGPQTDSFALTASQATCSWTAISDSTWLSITNPAPPPPFNGVGSASISYSITANASGISRTAHILVAGQTYTVTQTACTISLSPSAQAFPVTGTPIATPATVTVTTQAGCPWTAAVTSGASWITITAFTGPGPGTVTYTVAANTGASQRTGTINIGGVAFNVTQDGQTCTYSLDTKSQNFSSAGAPGTVNVTTQPGCTWTAVSNVQWITPGAGSTGSGPFTYTVLANSGGARTGTLIVAGVTLTVTQDAGCTTSLTSISPVMPFPSSGGTGICSITASAGCTWTVSATGTPWISGISPASGSGNGNVTYIVAANTTNVQRTGFIYAQGAAAPLTVTQDPAGCTYSAAPESKSFNNSGGTDSFVVTAPAGCPWTAAVTPTIPPTVPPWIINVTTSTLTGPATIYYTVLPNATGTTRTGTITYGDSTVIPAITKTFTVVQSSSCVSLSPIGGANYDADGGTGSVSVTAPSDCTWTAVSLSGWITVTAGATGSGNGSVAYSVAKSTGGTRSGSIIIGGSSFNITQNGVACTFTLSSTSANFDSGANNGVIVVTSQNGCIPVAISQDQSMIPPPPALQVTVVNSTTSEVTYSVTANPASTPRTGHIYISGQTVTVTQSGFCTFIASPPTQTITATGGQGTLKVLTQAGCSWTATQDVGWINIDSGGSGTGSGTVSYTVDANPSMNPRVPSGHIYILTATSPAIPGVTSQTIDQLAGTCAYTISPTSKDFGNLGGPGSITLSTLIGCTYQAIAVPPADQWIKNITPAAPQAAVSALSTITYQVTQNNGITSRSGYIQVGGQSFLVTQQGPPCVSGLLPIQQSFTNAGAQNQQFTVTAEAGCTWAPVSNDPWITITSFDTTTAPGTVTYNVDPNTATSARRTGTISVSGQTFTVTQDGATCIITLKLNSMQFAADGGTGIILVTAPSGCTWTPSPDVTWITINSAPPGGSGTVNYTVAPYTKSTDQTGHIYIGDQTFTITQKGVSCGLSLDPTTQTFNNSGGSGTVAVTTPAGCTWAASTLDSWIHVTSGGTGTGTGKVSYLVDTYNGTTSRIGNIIIAGLTFAVVQQGASCLYSISPTNGSFTSDPNSGIITVTTQAGCPWGIFNSDPWITASATVGAGPGFVNFSITANPGPGQRTGTVIIAGQIFTIT